MFVVLPGDITHNGDFCFSGKIQGMGLPEHLNDFTNHRLYFFLFPNVVLYNEVYVVDKADEDAAKQKSKGRKKSAMEEPKYKLEMPSKVSKVIQSNPNNTFQ